MKCPTCGQNLENKVSQKVKDDALKLYASGMFSLREISNKLDNEISASTVQRIVREKLKEALASN